MDMLTRATSVTLLLSIVTVAGCRQPSQQRSSESSPTEKAAAKVPRSPAADGLSAASLAGPPAAIRGTSWSEQLGSVPEGERAALMALNERYFGALSFSSPEEQAKLVALGFPTVGEWLAASRMSDEELGKLAKEGSAKAKVLYADRAITNLEKLKSVPSALAATPDHERRLIEASAMSTYFADQALEASKSAFSAYVLGQQRATLYGSTEPLFAALMIGRQLGDQRATSLAASLPASRLDGSAIVVMYDSMLGRLRR